MEKRRGTAAPRVHARNHRIVKRPDFYSETTARAATQSFLFSNALRNCKRNSLYVKKSDTIRLAGPGGKVSLAGVNAEIEFSWEGNLYPPVGTVQS